MCFSQLQFYWSLPYFEMAACAPPPPPPPGGNWQGKVDSWQPPYPDPEEDEEEEDELDYLNKVFVMYVVSNNNLQKAALVLYLTRT